MQKFAVVLGAVLLTACASSPEIITDRDPSVDFSRYSTYYWAQSPEGIEPLQQQRIQQGVDDRLQMRGWRLDPEQGRVAIAAHVATQQKRRLDTFYNGAPMRYWGWYGWGPTMATTTEHVYEVGTLIIDMFDRDTKRAIWRGSAQSVMPHAPAKRTATLEAGLDGIFAEFPY